MNTTLQAHRLQMLVLPVEHFAKIDGTTKAPHNFCWNGFLVQRRIACIAKCHEQP